LTALDALNLDIDHRIFLVNGTAQSTLTVDIEQFVLALSAYVRVEE
jgi:hypothetical protein